MRKAYIIYVRSNELLFYYYLFTYKSYGPPLLINTHVVALIAYSYFTFLLYFFVTSFSCASPYQPKLDYYQVN